MSGVIWCYTVAQTHKPLLLRLWNQLLAACFCCFIRLKIKPGSEVIKLFSCSTRLSTKFQLLIKAKIPTNKEVSCFKAA